MKKILIIVPALALMLGGLSAHPQSSAPEAKSPPQPRAENYPPKTVVLTGKVSDDGKSFVNDKDSKSWKIGNPEEVKAYKNQRVTVNALEDYQSGTLNVKDVRKRSPKAAKSGSS